MRLEPTVTGGEGFGRVEFDSPPTKGGEVEGGHATDDFLED